MHFIKDKYYIIVRCLETGDDCRQKYVWRQLQSSNGKVYTFNTQEEVEQICRMCYRMESNQNVKIVKG
jgi:hypothetical protein